MDQSDRQKLNVQIKVWRNLTDTNKIGAIISIILWILYLEQSIMACEYVIVHYIYDPLWQIITPDGIYAAFLISYNIERVFIWPF